MLLSALLFGQGDVLKPVQDEREFEEVDLVCIAAFARLVGLSL